MKKISMICLAAGLACAATAVAKPPLQLSEKGIFVQPQRIALTKIVNGKMIVGEWQDYGTVATRADKAMYYSFDCYEGYCVSTGEYPNKINGGQGAAVGDTRFPGDTLCAMGSSRWYFGPSYANPLMADDVQTNDCFDNGGNAIEGLDMGWYWGGGTCVLSIFTSDDDGTCAGGDPMAHTYYSGVAFSFGSIPTGGYYFTNIERINTDYGIFVQNPAPGGSYLLAMTFDGSTLNSNPGTQMMLWGTNAGNTASTQSAEGWDDDAPLDATFGTAECYNNGFGLCPDPLAKMVGFLSYRCPADVNNDGFVNGDDYDAFASAFDVADSCADYNADGFVNGDDYDAFASNFDVGC